MKWIFAVIVFLSTCNVSVAQELIQADIDSVIFVQLDRMVARIDMPQQLQFNGVVTDSVVWRTVEVDSLNIGNGNKFLCGSREEVLQIVRENPYDMFPIYRYTVEDRYNHEWVYSETWRTNDGRYDLVYRNNDGFHRGWDDLMRSRICKRCLRHEIQMEFWYQHRRVNPETEYEKLKRKLR